ncbi:MAG: amidohydrolase family protein [Steroidobacteraceae bacterium]
MSGYGPLEVLTIATVNPARYFGRDGELGRISAGHPADLVLLDADP